MSTTRSSKVLLSSHNLDKGATSTAEGAGDVIRTVKKALFGTWDGVYVSVSLFVLLTCWCLCWVAFGLGCMVFVCCSVVCSLCCFRSVAFAVVFVLHLLSTLVWFVVFCCCWAV